MATDVRTYRTTDGGQNWNVQTSGRGRDIYFTDTNTGYCVGRTGFILKSTNGGINWFDQTVGNNAAVSVHFINNLNGFAVGNAGVIYKTTNGGINWIQQSTINSNFLNSVFFVNQNTGYIAGEFGTLLKTTNGGLSFITSNSEIIPDNYKLYQNYPNPFNPVTTIKFQIPKLSKVNIRIYDLLGKEVNTLVNESLQSGEYEILFDGSKLTSGIYYYSLYSDEILFETKKLLLIK
ncbi:MAG: T9SS type A sorting domain-containing protein [Ignavibacteria bacterium]|nr:T9SS type A sorting domain-containing protein [Ignavibacteria bacterium]